MFKLFSKQSSNIAPLPPSISSSKSLSSRSSTSSVKGEELKQFELEAPVKSKADKTSYNPSSSFFGSLWLKSAFTKSTASPPSKSREASHSNLSITFETDDDEDQSEFEQNYAATSADFIDLKVTGYSVGTDNVVKYHVDVIGPDGPLSTYTIRRRYNDFLSLREEMARMLAADKAAGNEVSSDLDLPEFPVAGLWSYFRRNDPKLKELRLKAFQELLDFVVSYRKSRDSIELGEFLSVAPSFVHLHRGSSYVSLNDYSVPNLERYSYCQ